jgi:hypothetical protein
VRPPSNPKEIVADIGRARADVAARVAEVNDLTASEVFAAAAAMAETVECAATCLRRLAEVEVATAVAGPAIDMSLARIARFIKDEAARPGAAEAAAALDTLLADIRKARAAIAHSVDGKDDALTEVVTRSRAALSHLQFQDVAAQGLRRLDRRMRSLQSNSAVALGVSCEIILPDVEELGGDKPVTLEGSGDVTLF